MCVLLFKRFTVTFLKGGITVRTCEGLRLSNSYTNMAGESRLTAMPNRAGETSLLQTQQPDQEENTFAPLLLLVSLTLNDIGAEF